MGSAEARAWRDQRLADDARELEKQDVGLYNDQLDSQARVSLVSRCESGRQANARCRSAPCHDKTAMRTRSGLHRSTLRETRCFTAAPTGDLPSEPPTRKAQAAFAFEIIDKISLIFSYPRPSTRWFGAKETPTNPPLHKHPHVRKEPAGKSIRKEPATTWRACVPWPGLACRRSSGCVRLEHGGEPAPAPLASP